MINALWAGMFLIAAVTALIQTLCGNTDAFNLIVSAIFKSTQTAVEISIGLIGILSFWLGILKLVEETGIAGKISEKLTPLFRVIDERCA